MSTTRFPSTTRKIRKNDLVLLRHRQADPLVVEMRTSSGRVLQASSKSGEMTLRKKQSLAIVLDTKGDMAYVVYVAGQGYRYKHDPFWIDKQSLIPYMGAHNGDEQEGHGQQG